MGLLDELVQEERSGSGSDVENRQHLPESLGAGENSGFDPDGFAG